MNDIILSIISVTLLILLLIAGIAITFFISNRQRIRQEVVLAETKLNFERELRQVETEVSEHILGQLARELHDNIGQTLTAMHIHIQNQKLDHPELAESFKPAEIYLGEVSQQLRLLSRTLNNDFIKHSGLLEAIRHETERLKALKRFEVHLDTGNGDFDLDKDQELMLFRILQEIIQNALRHSVAKNLYISLKPAGQSFEAEIADDGKGFDYEKIFSVNKASGLRNILKRAALANMECTIQTKPGEGVRFILRKLSN